MKNNKTFRLLQLLSANELDRFGDFVQSPFHNKNQQLVSLWGILQGYGGNNFNDEKLENYATYAKIYENPNSVDSLFRKMAALLEEFLISCRFQEEYYLKKHLLLDELLRLGEKQEFERVYKSVTSRQEKEQWKGRDYFLNKFNINFNYAEFLTKYQPEKKEALAIHLFNTTKDLEASFFIPELMLCTELSNLQKLGVQKDYTQMDLEKLEKYVSVNHHSSPLAVKVQRMSLRLVLYENEQDFISLVELLEQSEGKIPDKELFTPYISVINFCAKKIREKNVSYYEKVFQIFQKSVRLKVAGKHPFVSPLRIKNMVNIGCRLEKYQEASDIIEEFTDYLPLEEQATLKLYFQGLIDYSQGNFDAAIDKFNESNSHSSIFSIDIQFVLLKIYYEKSETGAFPSLLSASRKRVRRSTLGTERKEAYLNFCKIISPLFQIKTNPTTSKKITRLRTMLEKFDRVADKQWLSQMMDKLQALQ